MSDEYVEIDEFGGGGAYFKPKEHYDAACIVMQPLRFVAGGGNYKGKPKDIIKANVWVFKTSTALDAGEPSEEYLNAQIDAASLVRRGKDIVEAVGPGSYTAFTLTMRSNDNGNFPAPETPSQQAKELVKAFWAKRKEATAAAGDRMAALLGAS